MTFKSYCKWTDDQKSIFKSKQLEDFLRIKDLLINYFSNRDDDCWKAIALKMASVRKNCDVIDYQEESTADAYVIQHLLDRYHRFQIMQNCLLENDLSNRKTDRPIRILDVGTGPAPALLAFSDYYQELNTALGEMVYSCKEDYVEQSNGFRAFLHRFCEMALSVPHRYAVPYHHGSFYDMNGIELSQQVWKYDGRPVEKRNTFDLVLFSNFLTNEQTVNLFEKDLYEIRKGVKNHGLIIVVGAVKEKNTKYEDAFKAYDRIFTRSISNWKYIGRWKRLMSRTFSYDYCDSYGEHMREFYAFIKRQFEKANAWNMIDSETRAAFANRIDNNIARVREDAWEGVKWEMTVYQKSVWLNGKYKMNVRTKRN